MSDAPDYRRTVFLPSTAFPMKAGLAQLEPRILERWNAMNLHGRLRAERAGAERFILHDGPPYANGDMHLGHAMNHVLKDVVCRTQSMLGRDAPYVPGWDCHGLPIEWKVEEEYRKKGKSKDADPIAFRADCRAFAAHWVDVQREQLKRLGVLGDWDDPYLTMDYAAEATIAAELMKFAESGQVYRGAKPVMWSPVEQTALAEAEVEYEEVTSTQIDVGFEITHAPNAPELVGAYAVIWTTTPWTIPVNRAIAYREDVDYRLVDGRDGRRLLVASDLLEGFAHRLGIPLGELLSSSDEESLEGAVERFSRRTIRGTQLAGAIARHPWHQFGGFFAEPRPLLPGDFVTTDQGTGLVHMAPDHGEDDFYLCRDNGIGPEFVVGPDGSYREGWPVVGGQHVYKVNSPDGPICTALAQAGALLAASADYRHSYPHSWRSKKKLIFRCTPQWFVAMDRDLGDGSTLRSRALAAIGQTRWVPAAGENRIRSMVEGRPDWVLSRQRAWGVPITLFVRRGTGEYLRDPAVNARIVAAMRERGADAWLTTDPQTFLGDAYDAADYERVTDILDVWFDSGSTHAFVTEARFGNVQADLYLEGSDQHRGWFQSSLLESCGTRGRAPYKAVLTHGFTLDASGRKMSKSLGNVVDPLKVMATNGADILRLWVCSVDFTEDVRFGTEMLNGQVDAYRKLRNTLRYLLGALEGFDDAERVQHAAMPPLERWVLHRLAELDAELRRYVADFAFARYVAAVVAFCNADLSAFYFDVRKDSLYCDAPDALRRRAARTVMDTLFRTLARWLAPVLVFTTEEAWSARFGEAGSIHLGTYEPIGEGWLDPALGERFARLRALRARVQPLLEAMRRDRRISTSNEAVVTLPAEPADRAAAEGIDLVELFIVNAVHLRDDPGEPAVGVTDDAKCARCWRHVDDVTPPAQLCGRCAEAVPAAALETAGAA